MKTLLALITITLLTSSCSYLSPKKNAKKGYFLSQQMAILGIELSRISHKNFSVRCHPRNEYSTVNCKFTKTKSYTEKQVNSAVNLLKDSFQSGLKELTEYSGTVALTFEGI